MKNHQPRPYILAECSWKTIQHSTYEVAILPWGATEAHNYHLPYATDNYQVDRIGEKATERAWEAGAKAILLPNIPFGVQTGQLDIKLCMNILPSTQLTILKDLANVLLRAGIKKLVILNGHGGNDFKTMIRELSFHFPDLFICSINWFSSVPRDGYFDVKNGDHADEVETSLMLYLQPNLVSDLETTGDGFAKKWKFQAMKEGWAVGQREWTKVSKDTGVGNPYKATGKKGEVYFGAVTKKIAGFIVELAGTGKEDFYE